MFATAFEAHPAPYLKGNAGSPSVKWLAGVRSRQLTSCDKVTNVRSFTSILHGMVFMYRGIHLEQRHFK
jgi:hypothetical protein